MTPRAIVFDAYGTLFDVRAVVLGEAHHIDADADNLAMLGRQRQLEYTWLRSLMGRYEDFWSVTKAALHSASQQLRIELSANQRDALLQSYLSAPVFPEVPMLAPPVAKRNGRRTCLPDWSTSPTTGLLGRNATLVPLRRPALLPNTESISQ